MLYHLMLSGKFLWFGNSAWDFWGIEFWCRDFLAVLFESQGIFLGFEFCPHSIIPVTWSLEIRSTPAPLSLPRKQIRFNFIHFLHEFLWQFLDQKWAKGIRKRNNIIFAAPCTSSVPSTLTSPFLALISPPCQ